MPDDLHASNDVPFQGGIGEHGTRLDCMLRGRATKLCQLCLSQAIAVVAVLPKGQACTSDHVCLTARLN